MGTLVYILVGLVVFSVLTGRVKSPGFRLGMVVVWVVFLVVQVVVSVSGKL